ncbi:MAG: hypothetical protein KGL46_03920 [Hyphomicrobiales bacterium]|nr:hypothetical protein [Hyphomicrobiales bacterium]
MEKVLAAINGKKTYIVAAVIAACAGAQALGYTIPEWAWMLFNAAGLGAVRDAVAKAEPANAPGAAK